MTKMDRWLSLRSAMWLPNLPLASLPQKFWDIPADTPPPLTSFSASGIWPQWFVQCHPNYQMNRPTPHVQASTRHRFLQALTCFYRDMPCLA